MSELSQAERWHFPDWDDPAQCRFHRVTVDLEKCDGCLLCTLVCPANVLEMHRVDGAKKVRVKDDNRGCISCNNCHAICPNEAIAATEPWTSVGFYRPLGRGAFALPRTF